MKCIRNYMNLWIAMALAVAGLFALPPDRTVWAQTSDPGISIAHIYTEDFHTLKYTGAGNLLSTDLPGWYSNKIGYTASHGIGSYGALYSYGSDSSVERALGVLTDKTTNTVMEFGVKVINDSDHAIHQINVQYTGEQWRIGNNVNTLAFSYQLNPASPVNFSGTDWIRVSALDFTGPVTGTVGGTNGNNLANQRNVTAVISVTLQPNESIFLKWREDHGADYYDQGLAIDNLILSADEAPTLTNHTPDDDALSVPLDSDITLTFSEPVSLAEGAVSILCNESITHTFSVSPNAENTIFTVNPDLDFTPRELCTVSLDNTKITDLDADDPPNAMAVPAFFTFTIADPPTVSATDPNETTPYVQLNTPISITFTKPVTLSPDWLTLNCTSSGIVTYTTEGTAPSTSYIVHPDSPFNVGETCNATIKANSVSNSDSVLTLTMAKDYVWTFTMIGTGGSTHIHDIQGAGHKSPLVSTTVTDIYGVVTAISGKSFYMQDSTPDADDATSEGILVYLNAVPTVAVGDSVLVTGTVSEYYPGGASSGNLSTTEINSNNSKVHHIQSGLPLPDPTIIGAGGRVPPTAVIENDAVNVETGGIFDPAEDGIDFYESLEGMRVQVNNAVATGGTSAYGEIAVLADNGAGAGLRTPRGGIILQADDFNPERIILDDAIVGYAAMPKVATGTTFSAPIVGVLDYNFGNFKLEVTSVPTANDNTLTNELALADPDKLTVVSYNVENLDPVVERSTCVASPASDIDDDTARFTLLAEQILNNLNTPDIIGLQEIQDSDGAEDANRCSESASVVDASATLDAIVSAIETAGGPTYAYRQIDPVNNSDGGQPNANIRVAFLFNPERVSFVDHGAGDAVTATAVTGTGAGTALTLSPGRIAPTHAAFTDSRKPLAGEFLFHGSRVFVVANHFNSKSGDQPLFGVSQPPVLTSETQRIAQAAVVNGFVGSLLTANPAAYVVVLGDLNDFPFSAPVQTLMNGGDETAELIDLHSKLGADERYTYIYDGNSQALDHILVSPALDAITTLDIVHMNAERSEGDPAKMSDHDPLVAYLNLPNAAPVAQDQEINAKSGEQKAVTLTATDIDNDSLTYTVVDQPQHGTLTGSAPNLTYTADPGYEGDDSFTFTAFDGWLTSAEGTVTVHVTSIPLPNTAIPDQTVFVNLPFSFAFSTNAFLDNPGDTLTYTARLSSGDPLPAWLAFDAVARSFHGRPPRGSEGTLTIEITATDTGSNTGAATFDLNILPIPHILYLPQISK